MPVPGLLVREPLISVSILLNYNEHFNMPSLCLQVASIPLVNTKYFTTASVASTPDKSR